MSGTIAELEAVKAENEALRREIQRLKGNQTVSANEKTEKDSQQVAEVSSASAATTSGAPRTFGEARLTKHQIERYSRQMLCPDLGPMGTRALLRGTVLVVGAGGLGATAIPYLAAAGVGRIIIVDFDTVEESNLHRQIIHTEERVGMLKAQSAKQFAEALNSKDTIVEAICEPFSLLNAQALCRRADVVIDASDNVACRYLVNDAAVLEGKPLVSGCATRWEGQMTVYNCRYPSASLQTMARDLPPAVLKRMKDVAAADSGEKEERHLMGPCYRCLFPTPPSAASVGSCNEVGVLGPIPGTIGCLQALEAIKVLALQAEWRAEAEAAKAAAAGNKDDNMESNSDKPNSSASSSNIDLLVGRMLVFDGLRGTHKVVRVRGQQPSCAVCTAKGRLAVGLDLSNDDTDKTIASSNTDGVALPSLTALKRAHYGPKQLFPEYTTGVICEMPDSAPRVDLPVGPSSALTLTEKTGITCREESVADLRDAIVSAASNHDDNSDNHSKVIVVDVRPGPQQAIFSLCAEKGQSSLNGDEDTAATSAAGRAARRAVRLLSFDGDTFDSNVPAHVDTIVAAVRSEAAASRSRVVRPHTKRAGGEEEEEGENECDAEYSPISIHFLCRRGNKSRRSIFAVAPLIAERLSASNAAAGTEHSNSNNNPINVELVNVVGGLTYWARDVDCGFPAI